MLKLPPPPTQVTDVSAPQWKTWFNLLREALQQFETDIQSLEDEESEEEAEEEAEVTDTGFKEVQLISAETVYLNTTHGGKWLALTSTDKPTLKVRSSISPPWEDFTEIQGRSYFQNVLFEALPGVQIDKQPGRKLEAKVGTAWFLKQEGTQRWFLYGDLVAANEIQTASFNFTEQAVTVPGPFDAELTSATFSISTHSFFVGEPSSVEFTTATFSMTAQPVTIPGAEVTSDSTEPLSASSISSGPISG